jgi:hypothetical protein
MTLGRALLLGVLVWHAGAESGASKEDAVRAGSAVICPQRSIERVSLRSTDRVPEASGTIQVECRGGTTLLDVEVDSMKPASLFGGDYNTYVLWVVPPRGPAENLGEIPLMGNRGRLRVSTKASEFAALVTAEPHFLVSTPSSFLVLENKPAANAPAFHYAVLKGVYNFERSTLADSMEARGTVHTDVRQAFTADRLARRAGAAHFAPDAYKRAEKSLDRTLDLWHRHGDRNEIDAQARETVRLAVAAQNLASDRELQDRPIAMEGSGGGKTEP